MFVCVCVRGVEVKAEIEKGRRRGGAYAIPDKQPVIPVVPKGPKRRPRRLDANLRLGNWPACSLSHYKMQGHLKTLRIFFLPVLFFLFLIP